MPVHHVITYQNGRETFDDGHGPTRFPKLTMDLAREVAQPDEAPPKINRPLHVLYGAIAITAIGTARLLWTSFPLHPLGLLMLNNWAVGKIWFSIFLCWALKSILLRWGGAPAYRHARFFFIGLLIGESLAGLFWIVFGFFYHWPSIAEAYKVLPN